MCFSGVLVKLLKLSFHEIPAGLLRKPTSCVSCVYIHIHMYIIFTVENKTGNCSCSSYIRIMQVQGAISLCHISVDVSLSYNWQNADDRNFVDIFLNSLSEINYVFCGGNN